jgi:hypothetical protein
MHPLGNVNSLSGQLQLPLPKEDDCSFWQLSVKVRTKKDYAPMLRETRGSDGFLNRPKLASLKHRRFLTEAVPPPGLRPVAPKGSLRLSEITDFEPQSPPATGQGNGVRGTGSGRRGSAQRSFASRYPVPPGPFWKKPFRRMGNWWLALRNPVV